MSKLSNYVIIFIVIIDNIIVIVIDTFKVHSTVAINSIIQKTFLLPAIYRAELCQKQISVKDNGHCCHRPSSNWETNLSVV